jgi:hypothetical protein
LSFVTVTKLQITKDGNITDGDPTLDKGML